MLQLVLCYTAMGLAEWCRLTDNRPMFYFNTGTAAVNLVFYALERGWIP
jgi:hypothetical protein